MRSSEEERFLILGNQHIAFLVDKAMKTVNDHKKGSYACSSCSRKEKEQPAKRIYFGSRRVEKKPSVLSRIAKRKLWL